MDTLGELYRFGHRELLAVCRPECGNNRVMLLEDLMERAGEDAAIEDVGRRLRCSYCKHRGARLEPA